LQFLIFCAAAVTVAFGVMVSMSCCKWWIVWPEINLRWFLIVCDSWRLVTEKTPFLWPIQQCQSTAGEAYTTGGIHLLSSTRKKLYMTCRIVFLLAFYYCYYYYYYYYYNHFTAIWILSGTTLVSRYQKGKTKTNLDFLEQETVSGSGISWAICKCAPRPDRYMPTVFYRPDALPAAQPTASKHWRHWYAF